MDTGACLQRFVARQAVAIHAADPGAMVTVGSANPTVIRSDGRFFNYWSDECLYKSLAAVDPGYSRAGYSHQDYSQQSNGHTAPTQPAGCNSSTRFLDFYQAHIYPGGDGHNGTWASHSPFFGPGLPKTSLGLDKPLVLGEFPMVSVCMRA
jgi:hypothetical protein